MQLRRFGSLLPISHALLALIVGCSLQSAEPKGESAQDPARTESDQGVARESVLAPNALHRVESIPGMLQTLPLAPPDGVTGEIVQAYYRPADADLSSTLEFKSPAPIEFGRASNYSWLQGELLYSSVRGVWRLRYAAADDEDAYGGSVTLVNIDAHLALHAGQRVRIEGRLINPRSSEASPFYHVLKVIEK